MNFRKFAQILPFWEFPKVFQNQNRADPQNPGKSEGRNPQISGQYLAEVKSTGGHCKPNY
jgi:hypothetical protein